mmetsp:Transcript_92495/g.138563  ORF Transcript_92495/g.138563 Transcript_92495/m.138563 type:complete len:209 (-) Transcript_92495:1722-2348(-)
MHQGGKGQVKSFPSRASEAKGGSGNKKLGSVPHKLLLLTDNFISDDIISQLSGIVSSNRLFDRSKIFKVPFNVDQCGGNVPWSLLLFRNNSSTKLISDHDAGNDPSNPFPDKSIIVMGKEEKSLCNVPVRLFSATFKTSNFAKREAQLLGIVPLNLFPSISNSRKDKEMFPGPGSFQEGIVPFIALKFALKDCKLRSTEKSSVKEPVS